MSSADPGTHFGIQEPSDVGLVDICLAHIDSEVLVCLRKCITDFRSVVRIHMLPWRGLVHHISTLVHKHTHC
jgi:hypothetical protein